MIEILYFASVILSEVKNLRNVLTAGNAEVPFGQLRAGFRFAQDDKIHWG